MSDFLSGRRALVIGGSGGIGAAVSEALGRHGASVVAHGGHDRPRLDRLAGRLAALGVDITTILRRIDSVEEGLAVLEQAGAVDILVVSFGPYLEAPIHQTPPDRIAELIEMNLVLPEALAAAAIPRMIERGGGDIILFGAPRGDRIEGYRTIAVYASAKIGLASFVRSVARRYAEDNIRCNMICPGYVATEYYSPDRLARLAAARPLQRLISPQEVAALAMNLLESSTSPVNGAVIPIDFGE